MGVVNVLKSSFLSGICIGIAGFGYLARPDIVGSVLFTFALIAVVNYKLKLYTGTAGFIARNEVGHMFLVLFGNILGLCCHGCHNSPLCHAAAGDGAGASGR